MEETEALQGKEVLQDKAAAQKTAPKKKQGIPGSTLKMIAIITMLIDHIGAAVLEKMLAAYGLVQGVSPEQAQQIREAHMTLFVADIICRMIGRIAFPIFCFLLVEGVLHTRSKAKYLFRLFLFALISEIPFDLAFFSSPLYWNYQNVFFTLFIGVAVLCSFEKMAEFYRQGALVFMPGFAQKAVLAMADIFILVTGMGMAALLKTDYDAWGVLCVAIIYVFRKKRMLSIGMGCASMVLMSLSEITCPIAMIPVAMYNGKRGMSLKYFFYIFYPAHLVLLAAFGKLMGIF